MIRTLVNGPQSSEWVAAILLVLSAVVLCSSTPVGSLFPSESVAIAQDIAGTMAPPAPQVVAVVEAYPMVIQVGAMVHFDGRGSSSIYYITSYEWEAVIGTESIFKNDWQVTTFKFNSTGSHTVWLTVTDYLGMTDTTSVVIQVVKQAVDNAPLADAGPDWYFGLGSGVSLDGSGSFDDWGVVDYLWTFDDQGPQVLHGMMPYYSFNNLGTFVINLMVRDAVGLNDSDTATYTILSNSDIPHAEAGPNQTVRVGTEVTFNGSASTDEVGIIEYKWTVIDGGPIDLYGAVVKHTFNISGDYIVTLRVANAAYLYDWDMMTVHVSSVISSPPVAEAGENATIEAGDMFWFNASGSIDDGPGLTYVWNFRYNSTNQILLGASPNFKFSIPGTYSVTLTVTDTDSQADTDSVVITVVEPPRDTSRLLDWLIVAGVAAGVGAACIALVAITRRRK